MNYTEQQLFQVLCLLDVREHAAKHGFELVQSSLRKLTAKGLELILFRLYAAINGETRAAKDFRNIWPTVDRNQVKEFDQRMSEWFKELKERHQLETLSAMTANKLRSAQPGRLIPCLLELATLALHAQYTRLAPQEAANFAMKAPAEKDVQLMHHVGHVVRDLAAAAVQEQVQRFLELSQTAAHLQSCLEAGANDLTDQYYATRARHQQCMELAAHLQLAPVTPANTGGGLCGMLADPDPEPDTTTTPATEQLLPYPMQLPPEAEEKLPVLAQLDTHLQHYPKLDTLLGHTVGSHVHPYAVDGTALREAMGTPQIDTNQSSIDSSINQSGIGVDFVNPGASRAAGLAFTTGLQLDAGSAQHNTVNVVEVVDDWVTDLEQLGGSLSGLVCTTDSDQPFLGCSRHSVSSQSSFGLGHRSMTHVHGKSAGEALHPLLAPPSDSTSHAALLATQLRSHKAMGTTLHSMVVQLRTRLLDAESKLHQVLPEVKQVMEQQQQQQQQQHLGGPASVSSSMTSLRGSHPSWLSAASPRVAAANTDGGAGGGGPGGNAAALQHVRASAARRLSGVGVATALPSPSPRVKPSARLEWLLKRHVTTDAPQTPSRGLASPMHGTTPRRTPKTTSRRAALAAFNVRQSLPIPVHDSAVAKQLLLSTQTSVPVAVSEDAQAGGMVVHAEGMDVDTWGSAGGNAADDAVQRSAAAHHSPPPGVSRLVVPVTDSTAEAARQSSSGSEQAMVMMNQGLAELAQQQEHVEVMGGGLAATAFSPSHPLHGLMPLDDDDEDEDGEDLLFHFKAR